MVARVERRVAVALELSAKRVDQPMQATLMQTEGALHRITDHAGECRRARGEQHERAGRARDQGG